MRCALGIFLVAVSACASAPIEEDHEFAYAFLSGRYAVIGKEPDGGRAYSGTAEIRHERGVLAVTRRIGTTTAILEGRIEIAAHGEREVVRFTWPGHAATCIQHSDLDNYGRLTCYWTINGREHKEPGLEAYFSTEAWR